MLKHSLIALSCCFLAFTAHQALEQRRSWEFARRGNSPFPQGRIVGGRNAVEGQFPHQVSLMIHGKHFCGGSIVARYYILTAAHCVVSKDASGIERPYKPQILTIRAGTINQESGGVVVPVAQVIVHERYENLKQDIALLRLATPLTFTSNMQPIGLATSEPTPGSIVDISGWGRLSTNGSAPSTLQWTTVSAMSTDDCNLSLGKYASKSLICLARQPNRGSCIGDSGGPATHDGKLVGVASFAMSVCAGALPDAYTKVPYYLNWINSKME